MHRAAKTVNVHTGLLIILLLFGGTASAQSGHSVMKGYVAFENIAYVDKQPRARVELCASSGSQHCGAATETDEHGLFEINPAPLGEWWLRISAPGFATYETRIYLPSDFIGNLAVMMKRAENKERQSPKKIERQSDSSNSGKAAFKKLSFEWTAHNGASNHIVASGGNVIRAE